jgi:hypothetical protein
MGGENNMKYKLKPGDDIAEIIAEAVKKELQIILTATNARKQHRFDITIYPIKVDSSDIDDFHIGIYEKDYFGGGKQDKTEKPTPTHDFNSVFTPITIPECLCNRCKGTLPPR